MHCIVILIQIKIIKKISIRLLINLNKFKIANNLIFKTENIKYLQKEEEIGERKIKVYNNHINCNNMRIIVMLIQKIINIIRLEILLINKINRKKIR